MSETTDLMLTEQNLLEAELVCGYKYWKAHEEAAEIADRAEQAYKYALDQSVVGLAELKNSVKKNLTVEKLPEWHQKRIRNAYQTAVSQVQATNAGIEKANAKQKKKRILEWFLFALCVVGWIGFELGGVLIGSATGNEMLMLLFMPIACIFFVAAIVFFVVAFKKRGTLSAMPIPTFAEYVRDEYTKDDLYNMYAEDPDNKVAQFSKKSKEDIAKAEKKMKTAKLGLSDYESTEGSWICRNLTVIPEPYFTADAINHMLYFYICKRADTVRDLINMYEQKKFQDELIGAIHSVANSIDRLAGTIEARFDRLGLQLGLVHDAIKENTKMQAINSKKLDEVKDETTRRYLEMANEIKKLENVSVQVITETVETVTEN